MGAITAGSIVLPSGGFIRSGQTAFDTGNGFFIGNTGGVAQFSFGNSTGAKLTYDSTTKVLTNTASFVEQEVALATGTGVPYLFITSTTDGSVLYIAYDGGGTTATILRLLKDTTTGNYYITHSTTLTVSSAGLGGLAATSANLFVHANISGTGSIRRYSLADLTGVTSMTVTIAATQGSLWSDGTNVYFMASSNNFDKYTISGTTMTNAATIAFTSAGNPAGNVAAISDGTNVWVTDGDGSTTTNIRKYVVAGGAVVSTTSPILHVDVLPNSINGALGGVKLFLGSIATLGIGWGFNVYKGAAVNGMLVHLTAIALP